jgi:glyoxylase-like metal-dependent hydrolase (beta-lactamase superfamily II)
VALSSKAFNDTVEVGANTNQQNKQIGEADMKTIKQLGILLSCLSLSLLATAEEAKKPELGFATTEVAPGIYMLSGVGGFTGGNIGLSIGDDGVVMIDDSMPPLLDKMKAAVKSITNKPVDFLINTHVHGDHTGNNKSMGEDGTRIVAHDNLRINMLVKGLQTAEGKKPMPKAALPVITFSHAMSFHLNGEDARIFHVANAHTDGDAVIHYKNANVIHTGDTFFNGMFPYIDINNGGNVDGYIAAQAKMISVANADTKIIPGHGPLSNVAELKTSLAMLKDSRAIIAKLIKQGKTEQQVIDENPLQKYHKDWNWGFITTEKMTRQVYKSLKQ